MSICQRCALRLSRATRSPAVRLQHRWYAVDTTQQPTTPTQLSSEALPSNDAPTKLSAVTSPQRTSSPPTLYEQIPREQRLSILKHKRRGDFSLNRRKRSAIHDIDVATRLGVRYSRPVVGGFEFQYSTYNYNKQTQKLLPLLPDITTKLLDAYTVLKPSQLNRDGKKTQMTRLDIGKWRMNPDKNIVSAPLVKDYGHKVVIDAFFHDPSADKDESEKKGGRQRAGRGRGR